MKVTGSTTSIEPPEGFAVPPCPKCFLVPTRFLLLEADLFSRLKARVRRIPIDRCVLRLRPCDHIIPIRTAEDMTRAMGMADEEE